MANVIILRMPIHSNEPLSVSLRAKTVPEASLDCAGLVDCVEDAIDALAVRMHLLRRDQFASKNSPWTWKQLTRIEGRLEELQIVLKSARNKSG